MSEFVSSIVAWIKRYPGFSALAASFVLTWNLSLCGVVGGIIWSCTRPSESPTHRGGAAIRQHPPTRQVQFTSPEDFARQVYQAAANSE